MDLSQYTKRNDAIKTKNRQPTTQYPIKKKCMQCGKELVNDGSHFYYQRFCSQLCKEMYIELGAEGGRK